MYTIEYSKDIEKDLSKLPKSEIIKILSKIERLSINPRPSGIEPLKGSLKGLHRIRSGNYRIVYQIIDDRLVVLVVKISHRRDAYRG